MIVNANSVSIPLPDNSVQCVVTSPPYWGLRKYDGAQDNIWGGDADCQHDWKQHHEPPRGGKTHPDRPSIVGSNQHMSGTDLRGVGVDSDVCQRCGAWRGGLGLEPEPEMFIENMVQIFREVKRVLRDDGVAWVNIGDCYIDKNLGMLPHRLALALQADGFWVRSDVIWSKNNPMPESLRGWRWEQCKVKVKAEAERTQGYNNQRPDGQSSPYRDHSGYEIIGAAEWQDCTGCDKCRDNDGLVLRRGSWRPTSSHEHLFMLAKSDQYYSDGEAVRERHKEPERGMAKHETHSPHAIRADAKAWVPSTRQYNPNGRNLLNVWNIPTAPYKGAHYATFPPELARRCVLSSTSRHACSECGMAWSRVVALRGGKTTGRRVDEGMTELAQSRGVTNESRAWKGGDIPTAGHYTLDHRPSCQCDADTRPCVVLDPFAGSGTVGQVCRELPYKRDFVGVDISYEYLHGQALLRSERITTEASMQELPMFKEMTDDRVD